MTIEKTSNEVLLVELPFAGQKITEELNSVKDMINDQRSYDVIVDFFKVELLNSWNIGTLLELQSMLQHAGRQLILCNLRVVTRGILAVTGLRKVFTVAQNKQAAMASLNTSEINVNVS